MAGSTRIALFGSLILTAPLAALAPETPWTAEVDKLLYGEPSAGYSHLGPFPRKRASHDVFFQGLSLCMSPDPALQFLFEANVAETHRHHFLFNSFSTTLSYQLTDDIQGDCYSSMLSFGLTAVDGRALKEPALFHFGEWEWRGTYSIGKEYSACGDWISRLSGWGTFGIANRGSPWIEGGITYQHQWPMCQTVSLDLNFLKSFGSKNIHRTHFHFGWAPFLFALLSLEGSYSRSYDWGDVTLTLERTLLTLRTFANVTAVTLAVTIPFSP